MPEVVGMFQEAGGKVVEEVEEGGVEGVENCNMSAKEEQGRVPDNTPCRCETSLCGHSHAPGLCRRVAPPLLQPLQ